MDSPVAPKAGGGDSEVEALRKRVAEPEAELRAAVARCVAAHRSPTAP